MTAQSVLLEDAVADHLRSTAYSYQFEVIRQRPVTQRLEEGNTTKVFVYGSTTATRRETRDTFARRVVIQVHVANYLDTNSQTEIDNAIELCEEIERSLENFDVDPWQMVNFESDTSGRPFFEVESVHTRNYFHIPIGLAFDAVI